MPNYYRTTLSDDEKKLTTSASATSASVTSASVTSATPILVNMLGLELPIIESPASELSALLIAALDLPARDPLSSEPPALSQMLSRMEAYEAEARSVYGPAINVNTTGCIIELA